MTLWRERAKKEKKGRRVWKESEIKEQKEKERPSNKEGNGSDQTGVQVRVQQHVSSDDLSPVIRMITD